MGFCRTISLFILRGLNKKRVFVKLFFLIIAVSCLIILLFDPRQFKPTFVLSSTTETLTITNSLLADRMYTRRVKHTSHQRQHIAGIYSHHTIQRLGLKPLDSQTPLEPNIQEPIINDVLSFRYPIDIDSHEKFKCRHWTNRSSTSQSNSISNLNRTLLIVVISGAGNWVKRNLIRQTWGGQSLLETDWIQMIFLIGLSQKRDKVTEERLEKESAQHGDLVQVNVVDTYENLTLKSVALLHWTHSHCPEAELVLKCDDDIYLNRYGLIELLGQKQFQSKNLLYGLGVLNDHPQRDPSNKYYISRTVWPWPKYPGFLSGGGYLLGQETIRPLLAAAQTTPYFPLEDVYLTGLCARKARISSISSQRIYERFIPKKLDTCFVRTTAMWQTQSEFQFHHSHQVVSLIYHRSLPCRAACKYLGIC